MKSCILLVILALVFSIRLCQSGRIQLEVSIKAIEVTPKLISCFIAISSILIFLSVPMIRH